MTRASGGGRGEEEPPAAPAAEAPPAGPAPLAAAPRGSGPAGLLAVALVFAALTALSWRSWGDVFVDFGRELYLPWRVLEGEALHRDLAVFNGPLSVWWNAAWMRAFGGAIGVFLANLALLALVTGLLWRLLARLGDRFAALAGVLFFLPVFGFGQTSGVGNYAFPAPYAHEATHGFVLSVAALVCLERWRRGGSARPRGWLAAAGLCLGAVFLTKVELFVACAGALALGVALGAGSTSPAGAAAAQPAVRHSPRGTGPGGAGSTAGRGRDVAAAFLVLLAAALVPVALAVAGLARAMPLDAAFAALAEPWRGVLGPASSLAYYRGDLGLGIATPWANLARLLLGVLLYLALVAAASLGERRFPAPGRGTVLACFALVGALLLVPDRTAFGYWVGRPLPGLMALFLAALLLRRRKATEAPERALLAARATFVAFALLCLAKMLLAARLWHYGFVLAAPAALACVLHGLSWLPERWRARGSSGRIARAVFLALLARVGWIYTEESLASYRRHDVPVGEGADLLMADGRGVFANEALAAVERLVPAGGTLLVLPEGVSLNYLSRRATPTRFVNFMPPELALWGEQAMRAALEERPPDAVLLVHKRTPEYGLPLFGRDFGQSLLAWVRERYEEVWRHGDPPLSEEARMGVALLLPRDR